MTAGRFVRDSLGVALSQYLARVAMLGRGLAAAAALGPAGFGGWNALNLIFDYGSYAGAGSIQGLDLALPPMAERGDLGAARRTMADGWSVTLAGAALFSLAVAVYLAAGGRAFAGLPEPGAPLLMLAAAVLQLALQYHTAGLRALARFRAVSVTNATQAMLGGALGMALVWRWGVWGLLGGWLAGTLVALGLARRAAPEIPLEPGSLARGLEVARAGLPIFSYFALTLALRSMDRLALANAGASESLGLYGLGLMTSITLLHLPESAAFVLFPRMAAAAAGARDPERTRREVLAVHQALVTLLPLGTAIATIWIEPVIAWLLPAYRPGVGALRLLALGSLLFTAATVPGYFLLASGRRGGLIAVAGAGAIASAALVFAAAARDPRPEPVAAAAVLGYAIFSVAVAALAAARWFQSGWERLGFLLVSFVPALWAGGATLLVCASGDGANVRVSLVRTGVVLVAMLPALWFARGLWRGRRAGLGGGD